MLSSITLTNFQSHGDTTIRLSPRLTAILGRSDSGKTAVVRALEWLRTNRPRGVGIIRQGQKECEVVVVANEHEVRRRKSTGKTNEYGVDDQTFSVVGLDVPEAVSSVLNLDDVNVQTQIESHYLILSPPTQIASAINTTCGLDIGMQALEHLLRQLKGIKQRQKTTREYIKQREVGLTSPRYTNIGKCHAVLAKAQALQETTENNERQLTALQGLCDRRKTCVSILPGLRKCSAKMTALAASADEINQRIVSQERDLLRLEKLREQRRKASTTVRHADSIRQASRSLKKVEELSIEHNQAVLDLRAVKRGQRGRKDAVVGVQEARSGVREAKTALDAFIEANPYCPECGAPL